MRIWILCRVLFKLQNNHFNGNVIELCVIYLACIEIQSSLEPIFRSFVEQKQKKNQHQQLFYAVHQAPCVHFMHSKMKPRKKKKEGKKNNV